nr:unnamed protein product [Spirometra erinaceieuropaei]
MNQHYTSPAYRSENRGFNSSNVKKQQNARDVFIPPSKALLDPLPSRPTPDNPDQRVIGRIDRPALKLYLHILASSDSGDRSDDAIAQSVSSSTQPPKNYRGKLLKKRSARKLGEKVVTPSKHPQSDRTELQDSFDDGSVESDGSEFNKILECGLNEEIRYGLVERRLTLADFRPLEAPFVPELIKMLVNSTEADCHASDWEPIFATYQNLRETADMHACLLLQNWNHQNHLKRQITALSLPMKIAVLRSILSGFKQKPLHFSRRLLMDIIQRPLFDQFLRPNPNMKSIVKHTALPCNRTTMDTLAFLMLHLLHAWEYASNPLTAKLRLAKIYGPLLVSFAERPVVLDQDPSDYKTEEGAILEVVLEVCNGQFWDNLSMLQLRRAFTSRTRLERTRSKKGKLDLGEDDFGDRPESRLDEFEDSDYENEAWFSYLFPKPKSVAKEESKMDGEPAKATTQ